MAIVESLSQPTSPTNFDTDSSGDFHIILEFTYETGNKIELFARYDAWNDFGAKAEIAANGALQVGYNDGTYTQLLYAGSTFSDGVSYEVDFYGDGSEISVEVDGDEKTDSGDTTTHNEDVGGTDKGRITHDFDTNDIELESWPLGEPSAGTAVAVGNVGTVAVAGLDPTILAATDLTVGNVGAVAVAGLDPMVSIGTGLWEVGAYIYDIVGGTSINAGNVGLTTVSGKIATITANTAIAVGNVGAVAISGLAATITNAVASAGDGITRIAMKMATILRR